MSDSGCEQVRVRVLFLEPGNLIHPSELDDGITEYTVEAKQMIHGEDYDHSVLKINSAALADALHTGQLKIEMISTPNDPVMEVLVPFTVVYFDLLEVNADWGGSGGMGDTVENTGIWETFGEWFDVLVAYARRLTDRKTAHKDEWGTKVQFMTMWRWSCCRDYWGEYCCEHDLLGWFTNGMIDVRKMGAPLERKEFPDALKDILDCTPEQHARLHEEARQMTAVAQAESAARVQRVNAVLKRKCGSAS